MSTSSATITSPSLEHIMGTDSAFFSTLRYNCSGALQFPDLALHTSCQFGKYELAKLILSSFPHPAITLVDKNRALKNSDELAIIQLLVENGADVTIDNNYPMYRACAYGKYDVVEYLLRIGATITTHAFCAASKGGHLYLLRLLIKHGAVPSATSVEDASWNLQLETVHFLLGFEGINLDQTFVNQMLDRSYKYQIYFDGFIGHQKKLEKLKLTNKKIQQRIRQIEITKIIHQYYKNAQKELYPVAPASSSPVDSSPIET
jgi:hypothetical protein